MDLLNKTYIGKVEAFEWCMANNWENLPRKNGKLHLTVPAIASGRQPEALGQDNEGFYLTEVFCNG